MTRLLFVHGADGYVEDRELAEALAEVTGAHLTMPRLPDDSSYEAWAEPIRGALEAREPADFLVAHSFGASILLKVIAECENPPQQALLLAMPDWSEDGWNVKDYLLQGPEPSTILSLHHCVDDEVVPHEHLALHAARMPSALLTTHPRGGHQFDGLAPVLAAHLTGAVS